MSELLFGELLELAAARLNGSYDYGGNEGVIWWCRSHKCVPALDLTVAKTQLFYSV